MTVLTSQIATLVGFIAGPHDDPDAVFTGLIHEQVARARRQRDARKSVPEQQSGGGGNARPS
ncbi:hypothetical protein ACIPSA_27855 [Streptomyces sp. NPDC086549]|uniref:hypothetical protein n=1 Tax=Streptomyces sp. NPDC086549 TaxID=3365752 RepID=UPI00381CAFD8